MHGPAEGTEDKRNPVVNWFSERAVDAGDTGRVMTVPGEVAAAVAGTVLADRPTGHG